MDYKIIEHIATLSESSEESKQLNIVSWNHGKPKYDLRRWLSDGKPGKGVTLSEEELEKLGQAIFSQTQKANEGEKVKREEVCLQNYVVIGNRKLCAHKNHDMETIIAVVDCVNKLGEITKIEVPAMYCANCDLYFISEYDFKILKAKAGHKTFLCQIIEEEIYLKNPSGMLYDLKEQGIIYKYGYNLSDGLSTDQRREILKRLVDGEVQSSMQIANHLAFLMNQHKNQKQFETAIATWDADRRYILNYKADKKKVGAKSITYVKWKTE